MAQINTSVLSYSCPFVRSGASSLHRSLKFLSTFSAVNAEDTDKGEFHMKSRKHACKTFIFAAAVGFGLSTLGSVARADFMLDSQSMSIDSKNQSLDFSLTFDQTPNFTTLNSAGQPVDSFDIEFNGNYNPASTASFLNSVTGVVRGDEIHIDSTIPIRSATGNGGPNSGGWGPVTDAVPYSLIGETISFSVPEKDLGYSSGHSFQYDVLSLMNGQETARQFVTMVPTPAAFSSGLAGLFIVGGVSYSIRRRQRLDKSKV
jgi:hypothetical protein